MGVWKESPEKEETRKWVWHFDVSFTTLSEVEKKFSKNGRKKKKETIVMSN